MKEKILEIIFKYIDKDKYAVFLFGSRASGRFRKNSDLDIGIWGKDKIPFEKYLKIIGEIEEKINFPVDVVDFSRTDDTFKSLALKNIQLWNIPKDLKILFENYKKPISV